MTTTVMGTLLLALTLTGAADTRPPELVVQQGAFRFYSAFWPNLHHVLYADAWQRRKTANPNVRPLAGPLTEPLGGAALTPEERTAWDAAVAYYDRELASRDLLFDDRMRAIGDVLSAAGETLPETGLDPAHRQVLAAAATVYRRYWWNPHDHQNREWITEAASRVSMLSPTVPDRLAKLYGTPWFTEPVRVDVVRIGNRQGAYTSVGPTHVTISSSNPDNQNWAAAEIVFHESSHALVDPVSDAFAAELRKQQKSARDLWHVALFALTGEVVREALVARGVTTYEPYLYKTGLFDRAWPQFRGPLEQYWTPYVHGEVSRETAIANVVKAIPPPVGR